MQGAVLIVPISLRATKTVPYILSIATSIGENPTVAGVFYAPATVRLIKFLLIQGFSSGNQ